MCMETIQNENNSDINVQSPRLFIFVGAYGSGKSEVSVHFARKLRRDNPDRKVLLADLDIINPFYRSVDAREILEKENIRVTAPNYANTNVDVPSVSGEMYSIFEGLLLRMPLQSLLWQRSFLQQHDFLYMDSLIIRICWNRHPLMSSFI